MKMQRNILRVILAIVFFTVCGAISANAQNNPLGKYIYQQKIDNGQTNQISFELKSENIAVYSKVNESLEQTKEKTGSWTWNKAKKQITVRIHAFKNEEQDEPEITIIFKLANKNLKVVKVLPASAGKIGDIFKKL